MTRWDLRTLTDEYPDLGATPSRSMVADEFGDYPAEEVPPPLNVRVDWLRLAVLGLIAGLLLLAGRWGGR